MKGLFAHAQLHRAGLSNLLFPWSRCEIFRNKMNVPMLAPQWSQPKIGPLIRRERDCRYYFNLFDQSLYVRGLKRSWILMRGRKIDEDQLASNSANTSLEQNPTIAVFSGVRDLFTPLLSHQAYLSMRLKQILSKSVNKVLSGSPTDYVIAAHVRRGDMPMLHPDQMPKKGVNSTLPDEWYIGTITSIRKTLGENAPVKIFSDATSKQLESILALPNVTRAGNNASIVDIIRLSRSPLFITTGTSTFSMWASFIGQMPTFWYPGLRTQLHPTASELDIETDVSGAITQTDSNIVLDFLNHTRGMCNAP